MIMAAPAPQPLKPNGPGVECPLCGCPESEVIWVRKRVLKINGTHRGAIVRARECDHCKFRFTTNERITEIQ